jgi:hypothetical protein
LFTNALKPGTPAIGFDFKYDRPGLGEGGTRLPTVDGNEVARKSTLQTTIPLLMSSDETFDVEIDSRTALNNDYTLPFRFSGTINKLKPGPSQV